MAEEQQPKYARTQYSHESVHGERVQEDLFVGDDYVQAGDRIRSMDAARKDRFLEHVTGSLALPSCWRALAPSCTLPGALQQRHALRTHACLLAHLLEIIAAAPEFTAALHAASALWHWQGP